LADLLKRGEAVTSQRPITKAEIKRECIHIVPDDRYFKHQAKLDFHRAWNGKEVDAVVAWFDNMRGLGMVRIPDAFRIPIYACNIPGAKTWYPETACVYYEKGQTVRIRLDVTAFSRCLAIGLTPGHFDAEGWNRIKDQNLAFRCDDEGNAVNGLFG
jgi:hypothetical protein